MTYFIVLISFLDVVVGATEKKRPSREEEGRPLLNDPQHRDPDALPPGNAFELIGTWIFVGFSGLSRGNVLYGFKAAILTSESIPLSYHLRAYDLL